MTNVVDFFEADSDFPATPGNFKCNLMDWSVSHNPQEIVIPTADFKEGRVLKTFKEATVQCAVGDDKGRYLGVGGRWKFVDEFLYV